MKMQKCFLLVALFLGLINLNAEQNDTTLEYRDLNENSTNQPLLLNNKEIAKAKSGIFIKTSVGTGFFNFQEDRYYRYDYHYINEYYYKSMAAHFTTGFNVGRVWYFNPNIGIRIAGGIEFGLGGIMRGIGKGFSGHFFANFSNDFLAEYAFGKNKNMSVGLILGYTLGYMLYSNKSRYFYFDLLPLITMIIPMPNVGISFNISHKHRLELTGRTSFPISNSERNIFTGLLSYVYKI